MFGILVLSILSRPTTLITLRMINLDILAIENKVKEHLKKARTSVKCLLVDVQIINETDQYIELIAHLQCKRTRRIRKIIINK